MGKSTKKRTPIRRGFVVRSLAIGAACFALVALCVIAGADSSLAQTSSTGNAISNILQQMQQPGGLGNSTGVTQQITSPGLLSQPVVIPVPQMQLPPQGPSRIERIIASETGQALTQFGYDIFNQTEIVVPQSGAVTESYLLGVGDDLVINFRGQDNSSFELLVDREGRIILPRLRPILAAGRTLEDFTQDLRAAVKKAYIATDAFVSLGQLRRVDVLVTGEVNAPGMKSLTSLSTPLDALIMSLGVKKSGSLRKITVVRNGQSFPYDLYEALLTHGGSALKMTLQPGDRIVVPSLGRVAAVSGWVRRPGIYELPPYATSISATNLIALAGGEQVRGEYRLSLLHVDRTGRRQLLALGSRGTGQAVNDGDVLSVDPVASEQVNQFEYYGPTDLAGTYSLQRYPSLSSLLKQPGALGNAPYSLFGVITRKNPRTLMRELIAFSPLNILDSRSDIALKTDDIVRVFDVTEAGMLSHTVDTYVAQLASIDSLQAFENNQALASAEASAVYSGQPQPTPPAVANVPSKILAAQAVLNPAAANAQYLASQNNSNNSSSQNNQSNSSNNNNNNNNNNNSQSPDQQAASLPPNLASLQSFLPSGSSPSAASLAAASNMFAAPAPTIGSSTPSTGGSAPQNFTPTNNSQAVSPVQQTGCPPNGYVSSAGGYGNSGCSYGANLQGATPQLPVPGQAFALDTRSSSQGTFPISAEVPDVATLAIQIGISGPVLLDFLADQRVNIDGAVHQPGTYLVGGDINLDDLSQAAGGTTTWSDKTGVEVISTAVDPSTGRSQTQRKLLNLASLPLSSVEISRRDQVRFNQVYNDLAQGDITIQGQIRSAGTFHLVRGERLSQALQSAGGLTDQAYPYGAIFLRQSVAHSQQVGYAQTARDLQSRLISAMTSTNLTVPLSSSTASYIGGLIKQLNTTQALGRMTVIADPALLAARPQDDIILEPGDYLFIPQRPSSVTVVGEVLHPTDYIYNSDKTAQDYIQMAGGYTRDADDDYAFVIKPDGSTQRLESSGLFSFSSNKVAPGSVVVIPRYVSTFSYQEFALDLSKILSDLALSAASLAAIKNN